SPEEEAVWQAADLFLDGACAQRGGKIIDHMATADVARDLDVLRAAVGDTRLTYAGYSYGTYLGVTYAHLFPSRVRPLLLAAFLAALEASANATQLGASLNSLDQSAGFITKRGFPNYRNNLEAFPAIACSDSDNPDSYAAWSQQGALADQNDGYFGRIWTW